VAEQQAAIQGSQALLDFLTGLDSAIQGQIAELTALREMLAPYKSTATASATPAETLNQRYTMQSERNIHENAGQQASPGAKAAAEDNVELFETPPASGPATAPDKETAKASVECTTPAIVAAPARAPELGDNVDLF